MAMAGPDHERARAVAVRHVAFEDLGAFAPVLSALGYETSYVDAGVDDVCAPEINQADLVVVLGGPIGACQDDVYPFLSDEIALIERRLTRNLPTLGVCLGAQLMARALGAKVYPGNVEIGFGPIALTAEGEGTCLGALARTHVLHWHGDTFDRPAETLLLASTPACAEQAFSRGSTALAMQFHAEVGDPGFERWLIGYAGELTHADTGVAELRRQHATHGRALAGAAQTMLRAWLSGFANPSRDD